MALPQILNDGDFRTAAARGLDGLAGSLALMAGSQALGRHAREVLDFERLKTANRITNLVIITGDSARFYSAANNDAPVPFMALNDARQASMVDQAKQHLNDVPEMVRLLSHSQLRELPTREIIKESKKLSRGSGPRSGSIFGKAWRAVRGDNGKILEAQSVSIYAMALALASKPGNDNQLDGNTLALRLVGEGEEGDTIIVMPLSKQDKAAIADLYNEHSNCVDLSPEILDRLSDHYQKRWKDIKRQREPEVVSLNPGIPPNAPVV